MGSLLFIDLRDRFGITQLVVDEKQPDLLKKAQTIGREWVIQAKGTVRLREKINPNLPTGEVEVLLSALTILNASKTPPFTIEIESDGGDELRMRYRYLDIRRAPVRDALVLRHRTAQAVRSYLNEQGFLEIETPFLISSTPEGARDFVVPSRLHEGEFYALPQSPQTFKQLLMVAGMDRYYQIVRCFRDEDLRADRQPEFTQIDCEMSFVEREDVLQLFEGFMLHLFRETIGVDLGSVPRIPYKEAIARYGSDKPDLRFNMPIVEVRECFNARYGFPPIDAASYLGALCLTGGASLTRKQIDALTEWVRTPQIGAKGLLYARVNEDGSLRSSFDKYVTPETLASLATKCEAKPGDLLLLLAGETNPTRKALGALRLHVAKLHNLIPEGVFSPAWVVDFPLLEWNEEDQRFYAMHHPFTSPNPDDLHLFDSNPGEMRANAYDFVVNGVELGGGSIRIHNRDTQRKMFEVLGFTPEQAQAQFGFLLDAFEYGAPPHGGIAFGFDRICSMLGGADSIRDYIAFPKNNAARDVMIGSPSPISEAQLQELSLAIAPSNQP